MEEQRNGEERAPARPRGPEPRLVFVVLVVLLILGTAFVQNFVLRPGDQCRDDPETGGFRQLLLPGVSCE